MLKSFFSMIIFVLFVMVVTLESKVSKASLALLSTLISIFVLIGITNGLTLKLCGAIGVNARFLDAGEIIGPPQLRE